MQPLFFWAVVLSIILGVAVEFVFPLGVLGVIWLGVLGICVVALGSVLRVRAAALLVACVCVGFGIGMARTSLSAPVRYPLLEAHLSEIVTLRGVVRGDPDVRESSVRVALSSVCIISDEVCLTSDGVVLAVLPPQSGLRHGDHVTVAGMLTVPQPFDTDTGRVFDYPQYLAVSGVGYVLSFAHLESREEGSFGVYRTLYALKRWYVSGMGMSIPEPMAALGNGITAGDKRALGGELTNTFRDAGLVHIVVLSGYNITIVVAALLYVLRMRSRTTKVVVSSLAIGLFVVMTGAGAASVRAGIMATLGLLAYALYRPYALSRALSVAVVCMVLVQPRVLLYDPGFQLSVCATLGLVWVAPLIARRLTSVPERFGLRDIVASTLGTYVGVLPLIAFSIGEVSLVALIANILVLPVVPLSMLFSFIAGVGGALVGGSVSVFIGYPAYVVLSYILFVAEQVAALPFATIVVPPFPLWGVFVGYVLIGVYVVRQNVFQVRGDAVR